MIRKSYVSSSEASPLPLARWLKVKTILAVTLYFSDLPDASFALYSSRWIHVPCNRLPADL
jgi:hypothetical protein